MPYDIINDTPVLFVHIPKTGGQSIKQHFNMQESCHLTAQQFLSSINSGDVPITINRDCTAEYLKTLRGRLKDMSEHQQHPYKEALKFGIVRNPWDRFLSIYHYHRHNFGGLGSFEDFIHSFVGRSHSIIDTNLSLTQTEYLSIDSDPNKLHVLPDENHKTLNGGLKYANSATSFLGVDYIGRYETLKDSVKEVAQKIRDRNNNFKLNWERPFLPHTHKSENAPIKYHQLYSNFEDIYAVFAYYYADISNFGYTFSGASNCLVTHDCLRRYKEKNAT